MLVLVRMYDYVWIVPELQIRNNILKAEKMSVGRWSDYRENVCWLRVHLRKDICWISHRSCCFEQGMYGLQCRTGPVETDGSCTLRIRVSDVCRKVGWYRGIISSLSLWRDVFLWDCGSAKHGTIRVINISQNDKTEQSDTFMNK